MHSKSNHAFKNKCRLSRIRRKGGVEITCLAPHREREQGKLDLTRDLLLTVALDLVICTSLKTWLILQSPSEPYDTGP
ncbi:hypothetical protein N7463_001236 [Penicillium fimorum]|uniref:Uncharacterized protein n=1 Tax=Penicillium fimorum TaxID=1882269 RepID=A0A9X0CCS0_9EURO|nr:hypothetical protein N7463_001236 [Penicillium fimorum]